MSIFSLNVEKHVIGGIINNPSCFVEIANFISEKDFYNENHGIIYCVIKDILSRSEHIDKVIVAEKVKNIGVEMPENIDPFDYIESICYSKINKQAVIEACQELVKLRIRREIQETGDKIKNHSKNAGNMSIDELISESDKIYNEKISILDTNEKPENVFDGIEEFIETSRLNQTEDLGILTPYKEFNDLYGGLRPKNVYSFVSRPGVGKSTFLCHLAFNASKLTNFKVKVLYLDTEMETNDIKWRLVSSLTGVPMWYLENGKWANNADFTAKVRKCLAEMKNYSFSHIKVGNKTIDQIISLAKRWHYTNAGRGNASIIVYDYIKLTGEKVSEHWKEYQAIGDKIDKVKKLAEELNSIVLTAMQLNRTGESHNKKGGDFADDSSAISTSDRLQWFCSYVGIFRRKVAEEIQQDGGLKFGTHKLITLKSRFQGKNAPGHQDLIKRKFPDGSEKYVYNYLSFDVDNFNVIEKGSLRTIIEATEVAPLTNEDDGQDGEIKL